MKNLLLSSLFPSGNIFVLILNPNDKVILGHEDDEEPLHLDAVATLVVVVFV